MTRAPELELDPPYDAPDYHSTKLRCPKRPFLRFPEGPTELHGPAFGEGLVRPEDADLTNQHGGEPLGERIIVSGRLLDERGEPVAGQLIEVWQTNAAGRYAHRGDQHPAPLDPNFSGAGRCLTDAAGAYRFVTVKPGAYPWGNHPNAWRPAHIHFSVFGRAFTERLVTQMYFPGDPLFEFDPIFNSVSERARHRMVSTFELDTTIEQWALGYRFDVIVGGHLATPMVG
ncbi:MAG: protocatechuate 3,4-dioxygenase subunit beta [Acidimicrobiales bacterium]